MIYIYYILALTFIVFFYGFILSQVAKLLGLILNIPNSFLVAYKYRKSKGFINSFNKVQLNDALETDIFLHRNLRTLWNITLGKRGYKFGTKGETLSSAIGHKFEEKTLSWVGYFIYYLLYVIDGSNWFKGGHCKVAYKHYKLK